MNHDTAERLWMTASFKTNEEAMDALLSLPNSLPYSGNSTTGLDGGEDIDPDDDTYYDDTPTNDPELDPDYLAFLTEMPRHDAEPGPRCVSCGSRHICAPDGIIRCVACASKDIEYIPDWNAPDTQAPIHCSKCGGVLPGAPLCDDWACSCSFALPAAPLCAAVDMMPLVSSVASDFLEGSRQDAALLQTPNLIERWRDAVRKARAAQSPIEQREWLEQALSLTKLLISPSICSCGVAYNALTKRCEACDERERLMEDRRAHIAGTTRQRDAGVPF